ncbi:MAG: tetratricopeptide repeat protein [Planctomycetaceae bacterium]
MDSQHRHELQQNDLRKLTNKSLPFVKEYGTPLLVAIGLLTVALVGGGWWFTSGQTSSAESWTQLDAALQKENASADDFASVIDRHPHSGAAHWAQLIEADGYLKSGLQYLFTDREAALTDLKKAQSAFERLAGGGSGIVSDIRERALFGLARCLEATSGGETQAAADAYRRLDKEFPNSMYHTLATERIAALEKPVTKEFYAWFQQQNPKRSSARFPVPQTE